MSPDYSEAMPALYRLRNRLANEDNPPIDEVLDTAGCVPRIIQLLSNDNTKLQFEALWVITNLCSGTDARQTQKVVEFGALPPLIALLASPRSNTCEQAIWALGNIEGTNTEMRNLILELGFIPAVVKAMYTFRDKVSLVRHAIWAFSNGCRGEPPPPDKYFIPTPTLNIFPTLAGLLQCSDMETVVDTAWSLRFLTDMREPTKHIIASGICSNLARVLDCKQVDVQVPALRALSNISAGSNTDTQAVIDAGVLPKLLPLMDSPAKDVRKDTCWLLSNIAAGTSEHIRCLSVERGLFEKVVDLMSTGDMDIKKEAAWIVCNVVSSRVDDVTKVLLSKGALQALIVLISTLPPDEDAKLLSNAVQAIATARGLDSTRSFIDTLDEQNLVATLKRIQRQTDNEDLASSASMLISDIDDDSDDDDDDNCDSQKSSQQKQDAMEIE
ncbi:importin alpha protein [Pelomyxa schiedti]|nr:importin alpha protein [Pelomyxa schiedti]